MRWYKRVARRLALGRAVTVTTEIAIEAEPAAVWQVFSDFQSYPQWSRFLTQIEGEMILGARLKVTLSPSAGRRMVFRPRVTVLSPEHELRWLGHLAVPGLFDGEHSFSLYPKEGGCLLRHQEKFTGLLAGLVRPERFWPDFNAFNEALCCEVARRAEIARGRAAEDATA